MLDIYQCKAVGSVPSICFYVRLVYSTITIGFVAYRLTSCDNQSNNRSVPRLLKPSGISLDVVDSPRGGGDDL